MFGSKGWNWSKQEFVLIVEKEHFQNEWILFSSNYCNRRILYMYVLTWSVSRWKLLIVSCWKHWRNQKMNNNFMRPPYSLRTFSKRNITINRRRRRTATHGLHALINHIKMSANCLQRLGRVKCRCRDWVKRNNTRSSMLSTQMSRTARKATGEETVYHFVWGPGDACIWETLSEVMSLVCHLTIEPFLWLNFRVRS